MSKPLTIEELVERNKQYAAGHKFPGTLLGRMKNEPKKYGPHILIVSCFDSRSNPFDFLNITAGEALVVRNIAGRFANAAPDIAAADTFFHLDQIILIHHSNCGACHITVQDGIDSVRAKRPEFKDFAGLQYRLPMKEDNHKSLLEDFERVKNCGFIRQDLIDSVAGFWLDVETGLLTRVYPDGQTSKI